MNLPGREAKVARRISDLSEQYIEGTQKEAIPSPQGRDQFREAMRVAEEGCCKGEGPEKAGLSIWVWARKVAQGGVRTTLLSFACEWDWPISGNPSRSTVHG